MAHIHFSSPAKTPRTGLTSVEVMSVSCPTSSRATTPTWKAVQSSLTSARRARSSWYFVIGLIGVGALVGPALGRSRPRESLNGGGPADRQQQHPEGRGGGAQCAICDVPVQRTEMEFEIEFARDGGNPGLDRFHIHLRCFTAWEFERQS